MENEKIYVIDRECGILPIEEVHYTMLFKLFKKNVSGETMERGLGLFEVMEAKGKVCFKLAEHLKRLFANLKICQIKIPYSIDKLSLFIADALKNAGLKESIVRLDVLLEEEYDEPSYFLLKIRPKKEKKPLALKTYEFSRILPSLKVSGGYVYTQIQKRLFPDYDDILYMARDKRGCYFTEISRGNFFVAFWFDAVSDISSKYLIYEAGPSGILEGITRQTLLEADSKISREFIFRDRKTYFDQLRYVKEAFVAASSRRIIPIKKIDNHILDIGDDGQGGPITRRLSALFDAYVDEYFRENGAK